jgi:hypothetical protein
MARVSTRIAKTTRTDRAEVSLTVVALAGVTDRTQPTITVLTAQTPAAGCMILTPDVARNLGVRLFEAASAAEKKLLRTDWP